MTRFPGLRFDEVARSLNPDVPDLTQEQVDACRFKSMVSLQDLAPIGQCWLLDDGASLEAIPDSIRIAAIAKMLAGEAIMLLCRKPRPERVVRQGLLALAGIAAERRCTPSPVPGVGHC